MKIDLKAAPCEFMTVDEFRQQLAVAEPGAHIVYATGFLTVACEKAHGDANQPWKELEALRSAAQKSGGGQEITLPGDEKEWKWLEGEACLVQRRLSENQFRYIAIKRQPKPQPKRVHYDQRTSPPGDPEDDYAQRAEWKARR